MLKTRRSRRRDWTVEIAKRHRRPLSKRFNPGNATKSKGIVGSLFIRVRCSLCIDYQNLHTEGCKKECPFARFGYKGRREYVVGCFVWLRHVSSGFLTKISRLLPAYIMWHTVDNPKVVKMFKQLRKEAKKLITWV